MKFSFLFTFPCFLFPVVILAQHTNVVIGTSIGYGLPSEPSVAMNPSNPQEIMIGAMPYFYFKSQNGGATWEEGILESQWGVQADPCLLADPSGGFYYLHDHIVELFPSPKVDKYNFTQL